MSDVLQDIRYALRQMRRSLAFSFFVVATLAVGIGANTTIFSVASALLFDPLPWQDSNRLVRLYGAYDGRGDGWSVSLPNADDWRTRNRSFDDLSWYQGASVSLVGDAEPERLTGIRSAANLFALLGTAPALGRTFTADETHPDADRVVVLGHGLWQRRFGGDAGVIGRTIDLSGRAHTVIGVLPAGFAFPDPQAELYLPLRATPTTWSRASGGLQPIARLRDGVTLDQARQDMAVVSSRLAAEYPDVNAELSAHIRPLRDAMYGGADTRLMLYLLLGGVGFVLLIACVNVANLLLARATARDREVAVRTAIGAQRRRVLRQLLTENMLFAVAGGLLGGMLAWQGTRLLATLIPPTAALPRTFAINGMVLAATAALVLLTGIAFGLAPALHASRVDLASLLGGRTGAGSRVRRRRRNALVVAEVALASMLLVCAGLMLRSLGSLLATDPGFRADNLLTLRVALDANYNEPADVQQFQGRVLDELRALPGTTYAGAVDFLPLGGTNNFNDLFVEGTDARQNAGSLMASPGYIEAMGIPLLRGRSLADTDTRAAPGVVVVSRSMAERFWPGEDAIGKRIRLTWEGDRDNPYWRTVVGIVGDVRHGGLDNDPRAEFYIPFAQLSYAAGAMTFSVRTEMDAASLASSARDAVWRVDPRQPVYDVRTMSRVVRETGAVVGARLVAGGLAAFGAVALLLAGLGLYGVISYNVAQRTYEIGVRAALGANRRAVLLLVLRQGMGLVALGLIAGFAGSLDGTRLLRGLLHGVSPVDPVAFAAMAAILLAVAAAATLVPARRAAATDPLLALRHDT